MSKIASRRPRNDFAALAGCALISALIGVSVIVGAGFVGARLNPTYAVASAR